LIRNNKHKPACETASLNVQDLNEERDASRRAETAKGVPAPPSFSGSSVHRDTSRLSHPEHLEMPRRQRILAGSRAIRPDDLNFSNATNADPERNVSESASRLPCFSPSEASRTDAAQFEEAKARKLKRETMTNRGKS
jgi:hypothetical protein